MRPNTPDIPNTPERPTQAVGFLVHGRRPRSAFGPGKAPGLSLLLWAVALQASAFNSGSTGSDGTLNPSANTEIVLPPSGVLNYTSINIPTGVTVTFKRNALNTPVQVLVSGNVTVAGAINVKGGAGKDVGTAGGGNLADDGAAGLGGPGGFDGGTGGRSRSYPDTLKWVGGAGLGPGGGWGGQPVDSQGGCFSGRHGGMARHGLGAAYFGNGNNPNSYSNCSFVLPTPYGSEAIQPLIGGSGGGGGGGTSTFGGAGGGGGGGAILIAASGTLTVSGQILADGGNGGGATGAGSPGYGGGGSGGAIRLVATTVLGSGQLYARGGCNPTDCSTYYTQAANGRIRIEGDTVNFIGGSNPTGSRDVPGPVAAPNAPGILIATIAGQPVPANPTGSKDLTLPTPLTNPVTVGLTTTNIPPGNTIKLRVVPANGDPVEALSPAISGTTANGTTSVSISLPNGASTLQAIASFTVAIAMGDALSRFAQNERVERVEIASTMGGESTATLITLSGKRYPVPTALLQAYGVAG